MRKFLRSFAEGRETMRCILRYVSKSSYSDASTVIYVALCESIGKVGGSSVQLPEYVWRLFQYPQMDIDYTLWQMLYLCVAPSRVYRTTKYHKQTKNQWARDDPAFVAIMVYFMAVSALGYAVAFHKSFGGFFKGILYAVVVDFGVVGVIAATVCWYLANQYLLIDNVGSHTTEQKVEWLYAFDVHCNSFFPFFIILYVIQYFFLMLFMREGLVFTLLANAAYAVAFSYYLYVTFLGYDVLPFLQHTTVFLYPIIGVAVTFVVTCLVKFNICRFVMNSYFG